MKPWKPTLASLLSLIVCGACAPANPPADASTEYARGPGNPYEESFASEAGVRPIKFGGWIKTLKEGDGPAPTSDSVVTVHYRGTLTDGTEFDSSYGRGQPATFPLQNVIRCWTFGVPMMKLGEKAKLVCPAAVAYGSKGAPPDIPGGATLAFEIELLSIVK